MLQGKYVSRPAKSSGPRWIPWWLSVAVDRQVKERKVGMNPHTRSDDCEYDRSRKRTVTMYKPDVPLTSHPMNNPRDRPDEHLSPWDDVYMMRNSEIVQAKPTWQPSSQSRGESYKELTKFQLFECTPYYASGPAQGIRVNPAHADARPEFAEAVHQDPSRVASQAYRSYHFEVDRAKPDLYDVDSLPRYQLQTHLAHHEAPNKTIDMRHHHNPVPRPYQGCTKSPEQFPKWCAVGHNGFMQAKRRSCNQEAEKCAQHEPDKFDHSGHIEYDQVRRPSYERVRFQCPTPCESSKLPMYSGYEFGFR